MVFIQLIGSVFFFLLSLLLIAIAKGSIHEATAAALLCTSAVLFAGAAVTSATNRVADAIKASQPDQ